MFGVYVCQEPDINDILSSWVMSGTLGIIFLQVHIGINHESQDSLGVLCPHDSLKSVKFYLEALKHPQDLGQNIPKTWLSKSLANQRKQKGILVSQ